MKPKSFGVAFAAIMLIVGISALTTRAGAQSQSANAPVVGKVAPWQAIKIAQTKVAGKPLQALYEFDEGHWVYGVMIVHNHKISEVEIDPVSGKIGDVEDVTPDGEAKEVKSELEKAIQ